MFTAGERLDMQTLAAALGVGRTTLYRWVGDREGLVSEVLASLSRQVWGLCADRAEGTGTDRALDTMRRFMDATAHYPALRDFAQREPALALRVLMRPDGLVADALRDGVRTALEHDVPEVTARLDDRTVDDVVDILVQLGTALEWAPVIIGDEPPLDRAIRLAGALLEVTLRT